MAGLGFIARLVPIYTHWILFCAAFSPYLMIGAPVSAIVLLLGNRWVLGAVACALTTAAVATQLPLYIPAQNAVNGISIRVLTANLDFSRADVKSIVAIAGSEADVLALQELTPQAVKEFAGAGLDAIFPYQILDARDLASGVGLYSRFPIIESKRIYQYRLAMVRANVKVDGIATDLTLVVPHLPGPWPQPLDDWQQDLNHLSTTLRALATTAGSGCVIAAGDFNSTLDMQPFRSLIRQDGYRDAAEQSGSGITATFPANMRIPPLIAIDHVLTHQCSAVSANTVKLPGSDHRGLVATVTVPRSPTAP